MQTAGYFDQMHMVKDFKALASATPSHLEPMIRPFFTPEGTESASADVRSLLSETQAKTVL